LPVTDLSSLQEDLDLLRTAGAKAAAIAMRHFNTKLDVRWKDGLSPVTDADLEVDDYLKKTLLAARPHYGWLSEETADSPERLSARRTFVVDPIDGTRAFIAGKDVWCVSIAIVENNRSVAGYLNCPVRSEEYAVTEGGGAFLNGRPMSKLEDNHPIRISGPKPMLAALPAAFAARCAFQPNVPSLAYRIAMIAAGEFDGTIVKPNSHDWDLAASELILRECGGALVDLEGKAPPFATANPAHGALVAASNPAMNSLLAAAKFVAANLSPAMAS
jgi:myo-inositol-1(or 4)-monophosphatase